MSAAFYRVCDPRGCLCRLVVLWACQSSVPASFLGSCYHVDDAAFYRCLSMVRSKSHVCPRRLKKELEVLKEDELELLREALISEKHFLQSVMTLIQLSLTLIRHRDLARPDFLLSVSSL